MTILDKQNIRNVENAAISSGFSAARMMENAGSAAVSVLLEKKQVQGQYIVVLCGCGNNGGDGFVVARKLHEEGAKVAVILTGGMPKTAEAQEALSKLTAYPIRIYKENDSDARLALEGAQILIDAIYGIGFHGSVDENVARILALANRLPAYRVALDLPSGCECDSGAVFGTCFSAHLTVTFIAVKPCHVLAPASDYCGKLVRVGIGLSKTMMAAGQSKIHLIDTAFVKNALPKLSKNSHKGTCGTALMLCGSYGMAGAALLSGKAALKSGAGLCRIILPDAIYPIVAAALPEAVYLPLPTRSGTVDADAYPKIFDEAQKADAMCIGCGLKNTENTAALVTRLLKNNKTPLVIDADGINILSDNIDILPEITAPTVLTPHPGEMARLLHVSKEDIAKNRFMVAGALAQKFKMTVVLKGANTVVALPDGTLYVCMCGNPGMATGGSGDTLAGIITALMAGGMTPQNAAICGVQIHAMAGDIASARHSMHAMLPSDLIDCIGDVFREFEE